jgi:hypothetical protein
LGKIARPTVKDPLVVLRAADQQCNLVVEFEMSRVEHIERQVKSLTLDEMKAFRVWFARFDAELWDDQIESDAKNGKLLSLAEHALPDHESGSSTVL